MPNTIPQPYVSYYNADGTTTITLPNTGLKADVKVIFSTNETRCMVSCGGMVTESTSATNNDLSCIEDAINTMDDLCENMKRWFAAHDCEDED